MADCWVDDVEEDCAADVVDVWWCLFGGCAEDEIAELAGACCRNAAMKDDRKKGRWEEGIVMGVVQCWDVVRSRPARCGFVLSLRVCG